MEPGDHGLEHQADVHSQLRLKRPGVRSLQPKTAATGRDGASQRGRDTIRRPTKVRQRQNAPRVQTQTSVRQAARRPTSGSGLSLSILSQHAALYDPGEFRHRYGSVLRCRTWPSPGSEQLSTPVDPAIRFTQGTYFGASRFTSATACQVARPPVTDRTKSPRPQRTFTSRLPAGRSPSLPLDMTTTVS